MGDVQRRLPLPTQRPQRDQALPGDGRQRRHYWRGPVRRRNAHPAGQMERGDRRRLPGWGRSQSLSRVVYGRHVAFLERLHRIGPHLPALWMVVPRNRLPAPRRRRIPFRRRENRLAQIRLPAAGNTLGVGPRRTRRSGSVQMGRRRTTRFGPYRKRIVVPYHHRPRSERTQHSP